MAITSWYFHRVFLLCVPDTSHRVRALVTLFPFQSHWELGPVTYAGGQPVAEWFRHMPLNSSYLSVVIDSFENLVNAVTVFKKMYKHIFLSFSSDPPSYL